MAKVVRIRPRQRAGGNRITPAEFRPYALAGVLAGLIIWQWQLPVPSAAPIPPTIEYDRDADGSETTASTTTSSAGSTAFGLCHTGGGHNCVVDGDTFYADGLKIRIADIDTPETHPPRCPEEAALGDAATRRLQALLSAGAFELRGSDEDRYGRALRTVVRDGRSLGDVLVSEGLARPYAGGRRSWCA